MRGGRSLVRGPWQESHHPMPIELKQHHRRDVGACSMVQGPGAWFSVHGPRQDGAVTPGQVSCSEKESVLSFSEVTKSLYQSQAVFSDSSVTINWIRNSMQIPRRDYDFPDVRRINRCEISFFAPWLLCLTRLHKAIQWVSSRTRSTRCLLA